MNEKRKLEVCLSPALYPFYKGRQEVCVVVVDVFRATTCMCAAMHAGVSGIVPVADIQEAKRRKAMGCIVAAERNVLKCDFADLGNSPFDYMRAEWSGKEIVMTTTNGTQAIELAKDADLLLAGAFVNLSRVVACCVESGMDVMILCAGWNGRVNVEDTLFAGALADRLVNGGGFEATSDSVEMALLLWNEAQNDMKSFLKNSEHVHRLLKQGLEKDIEYCLTVDVAPSLPLYDKTSGMLVPAKG